MAFAGNIFQKPKMKDHLGIDIRYTQYTDICLPAYLPIYLSNSLFTTVAYTHMSSVYIYTYMCVYKHVYVYTLCINIHIYVDAPIFKYMYVQI